MGDFVGRVHFLCLPYIRYIAKQKSSLYNGKSKIFHTHQNTVVSIILQVNLDSENSQRDWTQSYSPNMKYDIGLLHWNFFCTDLLKK